MKLTLRSLLLLACLGSGGLLGQTADLPDLTIDSARLQSSADVVSQRFKPKDCAVAEGCVGGSGRRKLLRFDVATPNFGTADVILGAPGGNPLFTYSSCHKHYHFNGYAKYELLDVTGSVVVVGRKQAFCLLDSSRVWSTANPTRRYTCGYQGIQVGWQDVYSKTLDCQWLDVTGVPAGAYKLRVTINPEQIIEESDYSNNAATVPVNIPF
jgi:hypothetical protein